MWSLYQTDIYFLIFFNYIKYIPFFNFYIILNTFFYKFQWLFVIFAVSLAVPAPGRIPKVYNALITSNQNLEPSKAFPVYQPVLHNAFPFPLQTVVYGDLPLTNVSFQIFLLYNIKVLISLFCRSPKYLFKCDMRLHITVLSDMMLSSGLRKKKHYRHRI